MNEPKDIVRDLIDNGEMTEEEIVVALKKLGVKVTQPSINRIKNGNQSPSYTIGRALERLKEQRLSA